MSTINITAADVNKLRTQTGAGMMDCKKALMESDGDFEAAIDYLRKKGAKVSASRSDREANEGVVLAKVNAAGNQGLIIALSCETDFVAKNADFVALAHSIMDIALSHHPKSLEALLDLGLKGEKISNIILDQTGKIGEKISISRFEIVESPKVVAYIHANHKLAVLVGLNETGTGIEEAGKDVGMQIAAMNPIAIDKDQVDSSTIERELEIAREQIRAEGKPEEMVNKIAQGKLNKFYKDSTLLNQEFVKDSSKTIAQMLETVHKGLTVTAFKRVVLGA
jgi:elongation factor Ts